MYNVKSDIRFKTTIWKSCVCDYSDTCILVKERIPFTGAGPDTAARQADESSEVLAFKNCVPFINRTNEISKTELDNAKDRDIVMSMYNLIEYSDKYLKISGSLWQYYKDGPNINLKDSESFKSKINITGNTHNNDNAKNVKIIVPLKYLSNFGELLKFH